MGGGDVVGTSFTFDELDTGTDFSLETGGSGFSVGGTDFSDFRSENGNVGFGKSSVKQTRIAVMIKTYDLDMVMHTA